MRTPVHSRLAWIRAHFRCWAIGGVLCTASDPSFQVELESAGSLVSLIGQTNGTFLVGGTFHHIGTVRRNNLARIDASGNLVPGFVARLDGDSTVTSVAVQSDGRILVAGSFPRIAGSENGGVVRLLADGRLDPTFRFWPADALSRPQSIGTVTTDASGRIFLASYKGSQIEVMRIDDDGGVEPDRTLVTNCSVQSSRPFHPPLIVMSPVSAGRSQVVEALSETVDGQIVVAGEGIGEEDPIPGPLSLFQDNGEAASSVPPRFLRTGSAHRMVPRPDGTLLVTGAFQRASVWDPNPVPPYANAIARVGPDGTRRTNAFPPLSDLFSVQTLLPEADGGFFAGGVGTGGGVVIRFGPGGDRDDSWFPHAGDGVKAALDGPIQALARDSKGCLVAGGLFYSIGSRSAPGLFRMRPDGTIDPTFSPSMPGGGVQDVWVDSQDRVVALGSFSLGQPDGPWVGVVRLLSDGTIDPTFPVISAGVQAIAVDGTDVYVAYTDLSIPAEPVARITRYSGDNLTPSIAWTWDAERRGLTLKMGPGTPGLVHWEMSHDLRMWMPVAVLDIATGFEPTVSADDGATFFRTKR